MTTVLLLEADLELAAMIGFILERAGFQPRTASRLSEALRLLAEIQPAAIILDTNVGGEDCLEYISILRNRCPGAAVLLLGRDDEEDSARALDAGADDYVGKPFSPRILGARVRAVVRRTGGTASDPGVNTAVLHAGPLALDTARHVALYGERQLRLTATEFRLLRCLMTHAGVVVPASSLLRQVWGYADPSGANLVYTAIWRLRGKLLLAGAGPGLLETVPGAGFILGDTGGEQRASFDRLRMSGSNEAVGGRR